MGIQSASSTFTRFLVDDPVGKDFRAFVEKGLRDGSFRPVPADRSEASGFASWEDLFDSSFDGASHHKGEYVAFRFRVDRHKVPSILLKQQVQAAIREHRDKSEGRWPTRDEKLRIRQDVLDGLIARSLPQPAACEMVWDTRRKRLLVGTAGKRLLDTVREHLEDHLRVFPAALCHVAWARTLLDPGGPERAALDTLFPPQSSSNVLEEGRPLGLDFLTWLWFSSETRGGRYSREDGPDAEIHPGERLVLSLPDERRERVVCTTPAVSLDEARTALRRGKRVEEMQLYLKRGEHEYSLKLDATLWAVRSLRTPKQLRDPAEQEEADGLFFEKMYFLEQVLEVLDAAYGGFLARRLGPAWEAEELPGMKKWFGKKSA